MPLGEPQKRISKVSPAEIACPQCGSVNNVRIAGMYDYPQTPERWYCKCGRCGKGFTPRKRKEGENMAAFQTMPKKLLIDQIREKLTREQYIEYKEQGISDSDILMKIGMLKNSGAAQELIKLKKEWGLSGAFGKYGKLGVAAPKKTTQQNTSEPEALESTENVEIYPPVSENSVGNGIDAESNYPQATDNSSAPDDDDEIIFRAVPRKPIKDVAFLTLGNKGFSLNMCAYRMLEGTRHISIGVTKSGKIAIMPHDQHFHEVTYEIGKIGNKTSSIKVGGGSLSRQLFNAGVKEGRYRLARNESKGWWEGVLFEQD
ncbi:MAG: hypothetical protein K6U74_01090 [Firmicutes bacterium]|nr:hypothetical protein [Bacillota bacterium]